LTDAPPPTPPADSTPDPAAWPPPPADQGLPTYPAPAPGAPPFAPFPPAAEAAPALPFSKLAIAGFVVSCISIFVFGWLGALGAILSSRAYSAARRGQVRGRGLALAGFIVGVVGFVLYAIILLTHRV
jgi:hypothetical protein